MEYTIFYFLISVAIGWFIGQLLLVFFMDEIFEFFDKVVIKVRKFFNLDA